MSFFTHMNPEDRRAWAVIGGLALAFLLVIPITALAGVQYDYTLRVVALGGALLGIVSGVLGSFAVLREQSLVGDALSHAALPGVAIAFLFAGRDLGALLFGAGIAGIIGVWYIGALTETTRIKQDTAMAMVLSAFFALGITLLNYIGTRNDASQAGLDSFIFGQAASIGRDDVLVVAVVGLISFGVLAAFWKEFKLITFNYEFAQANGFPVRFLNGLLSLLIVVAITLGLQIAGVILMVGILIAPGVAARQWTSKLGQMIVLAGVFGGFAGATGAIVSGLDAGLPTGPLIIVVASLTVIVSLLFAPERGFIARWNQERLNRRSFAMTQVLRDIHSHAQQHDDLSEPMADRTLRRVGGNTAEIGLNRLQTLRYVQRTNGHWQLTDAGIREAQRDERNRDLWSLYRRFNYTLDLPVIPEVRDQPIENYLSEEHIQKLEAIRNGERNPAHRSPNDIKNIEEVLA